MSQVDQAFNRYAEEYDAWFDSEPGATIFAMEVECLRPFLYRYPRPYLEVGVGSGRFARALGIEFGLDPASIPLQIARARGIQVTEATGGALPFSDSTFGGVLIALTLCFVDDPQKVLQDVRRILQPGGGLVLGLILRNSPWAEFYIDKGNKGHPIYSKAKFYSKAEVESLLQLSGFEVLDYGSVLFQRPGQSTYHSERPIFGYRTSAGFVAISSRKQRTNP